MPRAVFVDLEPTVIDEVGLKFKYNLSNTFNVSNSVLGFLVFNLVRNEAQTNKNGSIMLLTFSNTACYIVFCGYSVYTTL